MKNKSTVFFLVINALFLIVVVWLSYLYCSSEGFKLLNQKIRKYWYIDMRKIITGAPEIQWRLNKHFRQIILSRQTATLFTREENQKFFHSWGDKFYNTQEKEVAQLLARREKLQQALNPENKPMVILFAQAYKKNLLLTENMEIKEVSDDYLSCYLTGKVGRLTLNMQPKPLGALFDHLSIKYKIPEGSNQITCQVFWATEKNRIQIGERCLTFDLMPSLQPCTEVFDSSHYYQWLQEDDFTSFLLLFEPQGAAELTLFNLTLHPTIYETGQKSK